MLTPKKPDPKKTIITSASTSIPVQANNQKDDIMTALRLIAAAILAASSLTANADCTYNPPYAPICTNPGVSSQQPTNNPPLTSNPNRYEGGSTIAMLLPETVAWVNNGSGGNVLTATIMGSSRPGEHGLLGAIKIALVGCSAGWGEMAVTSYQYGTRKLVWSANRHDTLLDWAGKRACEIGMAKLNGGVQ